MVKVRRLTLLIIPEEGGRTYEFKILRVLAWLAGFSCVVVVVLFIAGFIAHSEAEDLRRMVAQLEREKGILEEDVGLLTELEVLLTNLEERNDKLRHILSASPEAGESSSPSRIASVVEHYVSSVDRLRGGHVRTVPTLWPVRGMPGVAWHQQGFFNSSSGEVFMPTLAAPLADAVVADMRRAYYAAVRRRGWHQGSTQGKQAQGSTPGSPTLCGRLAGELHGPRAGPCARRPRRPRPRRLPRRRVPRRPRARPPRRLRQRALSAPG